MLKDQPEEFSTNLSGSIPAALLGNVISLTNELMHATWDYAWWHTDDERFNELRRLETISTIDRRDIELVVVSFNKGSLEAIFDWSIVPYGTSVFLQSLPPNITANALWDLAKYGFGALWCLVNRDDNKSTQPSDPLGKDLLPFFDRYVREAYKSLPNGPSIKSQINYRDSEREFSILVDKQAQDKIFEANRIDFEFNTRLMGTVVGIDYAEHAIGVRWEQFPEQTIWCDIAGLDISAFEHLLPKKADSAPRKAGFDVEVGWRKGATRVFPPDSIRIIQLVPLEHIKDLRYLNREKLYRVPTHEMTEQLNESQQTLLKWLSWQTRIGLR